MSKTLFARLLGLAALLFLLVAAPALAAVPQFNDPGFENTWNRADKPVEATTTSGRGYTWGPVAPGAQSITTEAYNGGSRKVEYFDKARMEVNNPQGNPQDLFYVTTGLLVKELVTGYRQDGDTTFNAFPPSQVQVAGDTNEGGANPLAPTYASFRFVGTFFEKENSQPKADGQLITARIDKAGTVTAGTPPEQRLFKGYDDVTGHNIADVFEDYGSLTGPIWNGSQYVTGSVFFGSPLYVFGRPITEPYWIKTVVGGVEQDVLVQLFERRVLTYTPRNPAGFKVEMGNVGQHYFRWRYVLNNPPTLNPTKAEFVSEFGQDKTGLKEPFYIAVDSQANFYATSQLGNQVYKYNSQGRLVSSLGQSQPGIALGQFNKITGLGVDSADNLYVAEGANHRIQKFDSQGHFLTQWNVPRHYADNYEPGALTVDSKDNIYTLFQSGIDKFDSQGKLLLEWGASGPADSDFNFPQGIAVDDQGNYYVRDIVPDGGRLPSTQVKKFDAQGHFLRKWGVGVFGTSGVAVDHQGNVLVNLEKYDTNGNFLGILAQNLPQGINSSVNYQVAVDQANNIYLAGYSNSMVFKVDRTGKLLASYSTYGRGDGQFRNPTSAAVDGEGNLYVYDSFNFRIQKFDRDGHFLLKWGSEGTGDVQFNNVGVSLAVDDQGNVYAVDPATRRVQKFNSQGNLLLKIGRAEQESGCLGSFLEPLGVTVDSFGNIFVADASDGTNCIQKFDREGHFLLQWGGLGQKEGQFIHPSQVVADRQGNIYVVDDGNGRIQKFDAFGRFLRSWGSRDSTPGDLAASRGLAVDRQGNIYILMFTDTVSQVGKFDSEGKFLYAWGSQGQEPGQFGNSSSLVVDGQNNVYVVDTYHNRVEKFKQT